MPDVFVPGVPSPAAVEKPSRYLVVDCVSLDVREELNEFTADDALSLMRKRDYPNAKLFVEVEE